MADQYAGISDLTEVQSVNSSDLFEVAVAGGGSYTGKKVQAGNMGLLPAVSSGDAGKFLIVDSNGNWTPTTIQTWNGGSF